MWNVESDDSGSSDGSGDDSSPENSRGKHPAPPGPSASHDDITEESNGGPPESNDEGRRTTADSDEEPSKDSDYEEDEKASSHSTEEKSDDDEEDDSEQSEDDSDSDSDAPQRKKLKKGSSRKLDDKTRRLLESENFLRRSGRARIDLSCRTFQPEVRTSSRTKSVSSSTRKRRIGSSDEESEASSSSDGSFSGRSKSRKKAAAAAKKQKKVKAVRPAKTSSARKKVDYKEDSSDEIDEDDVLEWTEEPEVDAAVAAAAAHANGSQTGLAGVETVEKVLKSRWGIPGATGPSTTCYNIEEKGGAAAATSATSGGDAPTERQFLIKWVNWSHMHNTWESEASLEAVQAKGMKKVANYLKRKLEEEHWRRYADKEYIEYFDCEQAMQEDLLEEYKKVERIVVHQISRDRREDGSEQTEYYIKWEGLPYADCTWENDRLIPADKITEYHARIDSARLPSRNAAVLKRRPKFVKIDAMPEFLSRGGMQSLRDYQLEGLNWMLHAWCKGNSCILADEMGLGKTIQSSSFLASLSQLHDLHGPFLVVVPLSTMAAWQKELGQWAAGLNAVTYMGDTDSRKAIREYEWCVAGGKRMKVNICLTTYEILIKDKGFLGSVEWAALMVDEAHRLKNDDSLLYKCLSAFRTDHRLLITGTPLQNSLKELWALLHFIMPEEFPSWEDFDRSHAETDHKGISSLHSRLEPYLLRRVKKDVEKSLPPKTEQILRVDMTRQQKQFYKWILTKNYKELSRGVKGSISGFVNLVMELKKCCNHASLIRANDDFCNDPASRLQQLLKSSGKLILLDKLLCRLKDTGHRVLIFSQMVMMLDIIQDYLALRRFTAQRLDGSMRADLRKQALDHFNAEGSTDFCFLLSTRAGGLGINLATADTVIIFDSDWNPQNDLQAMSRAHRIGQTKTVNIYRLVTRGSVEEEIVERAKRKLVLDHLVIQRMDTTGRTVLHKTAPSSSSSVPFDRHELNDILKFGASELFKEEEGEEQEPEVDIDNILQVAETRDAEEGQENGHDLLNAFKYANFAIDEEKDVAMAGERNDWDSIIPEDTRRKMEEEDREKELRELELGPRERKKVQEETKENRVDGGKAVIDTSEEEDSDSGGGRRKRKKAFGDFSASELKRFVRSIRKFARPAERLDAIALDAELEEHGTGEMARLVEAFQAGCETAIKEHAEEMAKGVSIDGAEEAEKRKNKGAQFKFAGVADVNVKAFTKSQTELEALHVLLTAAEKENKLAAWRIPAKLRPQKGWDVPWTAEDDAALLKGIHKYGAGSWEAIKSDPALGLADKIHLKDKIRKPQSKHLQNRIDYLLKTLAGGGKKAAGGLTKERAREARKEAAGKKDVSKAPKERKRPLEKDKKHKDERRKEEEKKDRKRDKSSHHTKDRPSGSNDKPPGSSPTHSLSEKLGSIQLNKAMYGSALEDAGGKVFKDCVSMMRPAQKYIKRLSEANGDEKETARCIQRLGDHAHDEMAAMKKKKPEINIAKWYNYVWIFLAKFCASEPADLLAQYRALESKHHHHKRESSGVADKAHHHHHHKKEESKKDAKKDHSVHIKDRTPNHRAVPPPNPYRTPVSMSSAADRTEYWSPLKPPTSSSSVTSNGWGNPGRL